MLQRLRSVGMASILLGGRIRLVFTMTMAYYRI